MPSAGIGTRSSAHAKQLKAETWRNFAEIHAPRRSLTRRRRTAEQVLASYNGRNATDVACKLGLGRATVYLIIKQPGGKK
jgi:hypothetical protein